MAQNTLAKSKQDLSLKSETRQQQLFRQCQALGGRLADAVAVGLKPSEHHII